MQTQAYFENIQDVIIRQIKSARHSVYVAVAWLTDNTIFTELCNKAKNGLTVELILVNDTINNDLAPFDHEQLKTCGGRTFFIPPQIDGAIMHHKFCIIDDCTIITGSYNWSRKARLNDENIVITSEACELGAQFKKEFDSIKGRIAGTQQETIIDFNKIIKRLEVIKNFAALEEKDEIPLNASQREKIAEIINKGLSQASFNFSIGHITKDDIDDQNFLTHKKISIKAEKSNPIVEICKNLSKNRFNDTIPIYFR